MAVSGRLKYFINDYLKSEIIKNVSILISGTVLAQLISILFQPLVRRLFSPEAFGVLSIYSSITGILVVAAAFRYDDAVVLPKEDRESANLAGLSFCISSFFSILVTIVFMFFGAHITGLFSLSGQYSKILITFVPLTVFLYSISGSLNSWLVRKKSFRSVAVNKIVRRSSEVATQASTGFGNITGGLILSDFIGHFANVISQLVQTTRKGLKPAMITISEMRAVAGKYSDFPKYNLLPSLLSACSYMLPPLFINRFFSAESAGFFDLSRLVLSLPLAFVAGSVSSIALQKASERHNRNESFFVDIKPLLVTVIAISVAEIIFIMLFGKVVFSFLFGYEWELSGIISRIMVWSFALSFIVSSFSSIFISLRRIKTYGLWQLGYFVCIMSLIAFRKLEYTEFLKLYVTLEVLCYLAAIAILTVIVFRYERNVRASSMLQ